MKISIISDIHSNAAALKTALNILDKENIQELYVLGDIVGYGDPAEANECCNIIRNLGCPVVAGNHDWAVAERIGLDDFNKTALRSIESTKKIITPKNKEWLYDLPIKYSKDKMTFVHGTLVQPGSFYYMSFLKPIGPDKNIFQDIKVNFEKLEKLGRNICFCAHMHIPELYIEIKRPGIIKWVKHPSDPVYDLEQYRTIVNVGSISMVRSKARRPKPMKSSFVIYDVNTRKIRFVRFESDGANHDR